MKFRTFCDQHDFVGFSFHGIETTAASNGKIRKNPIQMPKWHRIRSTLIHGEHKAFAVRTGRISGITVIDCDTVDAYTAITRDYPDLQHTLTIRTPRGYHMYCRYHAGATTSTSTFANYPHVDIRSDKAIVFGPATSYRNIVTGATDRYWVALDQDPVAFPTGLLGDVLKPAGNRTGRKTKRQRHKGGDDEMPSTPEPLVTTQTSQAVLDVLERLVRALPPSYLASYDTWFQIGAVLHFESNGAAKDLFWRLSRSAPGYENVSDKPLERMWRYYQKHFESSKRRLSIATLYHHLKHANPDEFARVQQEQSMAPVEPLFFEEEASAPY